jgi:PhnB protein
MSSTLAKELKLTHEFNAPKKLVFDAFTNAEALNEWWGPVETKNSVISLDFRPGGIFHYKMERGDKVSYGRFLFGRIQAPDLLEFTVAFADEHSNIVRAPFDMDLPKEVFYRLEFVEQDGRTTINLTGRPVNASPEEEEVFTSINTDMQKGFASTFGQLEQYISAQFKLRTQLKINTVASTSTYLNFPGNTEEAFNFYKSVFGTEFRGNGIQRFGDIPQQPGYPPVADNVKKMILHVELPITGGHILMGTDAPKEMGFTLTSGNNMHICVEPETRQETKKLFEALSKDGNITMPLEDMFFGAYFGSLTDKYGINWMFNCIEKTNTQ